MERARLLCELVRKREKLKVAYIRTVEQHVLMQLNPLDAVMGRLLDSLFAKDANEIFAEPVDIDEVPDYKDVVTHPIDLGTMRTKLREGKYQSLDDMENDFNLMIQNCLAYNNKDTIFYRAGVRMRDQCGPLFKSVRKELIRNGIIEEPQSDESIAQEVDAELSTLLEQDSPAEELIEKLHLLMEKAAKIKHGMIRGKRTKMIKTELTKLRKLSNKLSLSPSKAIPPSKINSDSSHSDEEDIEKNKLFNKAQQSTPPCSPIKNASNNASPSGVNRRTAVLFTRKAQAAASLKKPDGITNSLIENSQLPPSLSSIAAQLSAATVQSPDLSKPKSPKKSGRTRRMNSQTSDTNVSQKRSESKGLSMTSTPSVSYRRSPQKDRSGPSNFISDSFRTYRANDMDVSTESEDDDENMHSCSSSCCSGSGSDFL